MMSFKLTLFNSFMYLSTMFRLEDVATLLVVTTNFLLSEQMKLAEILDFIPFKSLLMFVMYAVTLENAFLQKHVIS